MTKTADGVGHIELCDVPVPDVGPDQVLMKVYAAGICSSDLLIQEDRHFYRAPVTQDHKFSGIAYKVGENITRVKEGDKFVADIECAKGEWLGSLALEQGEYHQAPQYLNRALAILRQVGDPSMTANTLRYLVSTMRSMGLTANK